MPRRWLHAALPMDVHVDPAPLASAPPRAPAARVVRVAGCSSSTRRSSRSTCARCAAPPCCCSRTRPRSSSTRAGSCTPRRLTLPRPVVIRLVTYVRVPRDTHRRKITRRAVFARDRWTCQYCGSRAQPDGGPRVPRSKGGPSTLGQHRRLLRAVQPAQGRPAACARSACTSRRKPRSPEPPRSSSTSPVPTHPRGLAGVPARGRLARTRHQPPHRTVSLS